MQKEHNLFKLRKLLKNANIKQYMDDFNVEIKFENRISNIYRSKFSRRRRTSI